MMDDDHERQLEDPGTERERDFLFYRETIHDMQVNRSMRQKYAGRVYVFMVCYSVSVMFLLYLQGFHDTTGAFLPSNVLIALIGSVVVVATALVLGVINGLFSSPKGFGKKS